MFLLLILVSIFIGSREVYSSTSSSSLEPTNFFFPSFDLSSCTCEELINMGSASLQDRYLNITPELKEQGNLSLVPMLTNWVGRALYSRPVVAWPAMISTMFAVRITTLPNSTASGDGMSFLFAQDNSSSPSDNYGGVVRQLAVEMYTFMNKFDPNGNHSLNNIGVNLKSERDIKVRIDYDGYKYKLHISLAYSGNSLISVLNHSIRMSETVPSLVHQVINWVFVFFPLSLEKRAMTVLFIVLCVYLLIENTPRKRNKKDADMESQSRQAANVPKMSRLATDGFRRVYGGLISDPPVEVAVKKISATSKQGLLPYLYHILLAHFLEHGPSLGWETQYKILTGLASTLLYLHEECGNPVVHQDVKPNNVMMDSKYNAYLGDFGLARLLQNDASVTTILVAYTGKATLEPAMYSFGMVVLEVVCGRRSKGIMEENSLCVDGKMGGQSEEEQVKGALIVGLAWLHLYSAFRPRIQKVVQNLNKPLMELPES
ncbi:hypothetical protein ACJRO7_014511 [Eucalyptus globulus]|uniref:Protein kinase domain-containing protein n=1 Tax=Eucalyptus globulus TaxID=34317 RepID=A0ABD3L4C4_EUCGL